LLFFSKNNIAFILGIISLIFISYTFHLQFVILRQGFAATLFLIFTVFFYYKRYYLTLVLFLGFIHSSFFLIWFVIFADKFLSVFISNFNYMVFILLVLIIVSSFSMLHVAQYLGLRQSVGSDLTDNSNGGGGFVLFLFLFLCLYASNFNKMILNPIGYVALIGFVIYLGFYFTVPVSGRVISTFLPFYYIYFVSNFYPKVFYPALVFVLVNIIIFYNSIVNGSLTIDGINYLNNLLGL
jgi:hypothetical protein